MKTNNNHQICGFTDETVDYLYGEIGSAQKLKFEAHLQNCLTCADEIAAFFELRSSISEWKTAEFAHLANPAIEIPFETNQRRFVDKTDSSSWLQGIRSYFNFSRAFAASFAVLAIFFSLTFFIFNFSPGNEIVENDNKNKIIVSVSPTVEKIIKPAETVSKINESSEQTKSVETAVNKTDINESKQSKNVSSVKVSPRSEVRTNDSIKVSNKSIATTDSKPSVVNKTTPPTTRSNSPRLNTLPEEEEDESLRLADLFEDIDTK